MRNVGIVVDSIAIVGFEEGKVHIYPGSIQGQQIETNFFPPTRASNLARSV